MNYEQHEDVGSGALRLAFGVVLVGGFITLGLMLAMMRMDERLAPAVLFGGLLITGFLCLSVIIGAWQGMNHRANLSAESRNRIAIANADRMEWETEKARMSLTAPRQFQTLPPPPPNNPAPPIYNNGKLVSDGEPEHIELDEPSWMQGARELGLLDDSTQPQPVSVTALMTESQADHALRIRQLAMLIHGKCHDRNPTQDYIRHVIGMTRGGILRSNGDITEAMDYLARVGEVTPAQGPGIARLWLDRVTHAPVDYRS